MKLQTKDLFNYLFVVKKTSYKVTPCCSHTLVNGFACCKFPSKKKFKELSILI